MNLNIPQNLWKVAIFAGAMFGLFLLVGAIRGLVSLRYIGTNPTSPNTISVDGTGYAYAIPDVATFTFTLSDTEKAVADAQTKVTTEEAAALQVVTAAGVASTDVQTTSYGISPQYEYQNSPCPPTSVYCQAGKQILVGYQVSESIQVKLSDLTKAGSLLASLGSAGVQDLNGPSFDVDNPDTVQSQARAMAIADAQSKAQTLAKQLGVTLVAVTGFSENNGTFPEPIMFAANASATGAAVPAAAPVIPSGQQKVTDDVTITYQIR